MTTEGIKYKEISGKDVIVDWRLYDVSDTRSNIFKAKSTDKSKVTVVYCKNSENCLAFKRNLCINFCPYSKTVKEQGFTKKSVSNSKWVKNYKELFQNVTQKDLPKKMIKIGEYIYFNYSYWNFNVDKNSLIYKYSKGIFSDNNIFIDEKDFTIDFLKELLSRHPDSLMGGTISDYQKKVVPTILSHLKEEFNDLYCELIELYPKFNVVVTNVGRKALISSIKKDSIFKYENYEAIYKGNGVLCIKNYPNSLIFLTDIKVKSQKIEYELKICDEDTIEIQNDNQCDENTKFIN